MIDKISLNVLAYTMLPIICCYFIKLIGNMSEGWAEPRTVYAVLCVPNGGC